MDNYYRPCPRPLQRHRSQLLVLGRTLFPTQRMVSSNAKPPIFHTLKLQTNCYGRYPYPIFEQVPFEGRVGLFVLSAVVMALSTATLKWLHGRVNGFGTQVKPQARPGAVKANGNL